MGFLQFLKNLPLIDLGTGHARHWAKSKKVCFRFAKKFAVTGKTALDMGCGDGFWSQKLTGLGYNVTSVDHEMQYSKTRIVDLEKGLPFPDLSFDLVWSSDVLEHLYTPNHLIREIKRVLGPGGLLLLTTPNSYFWLYTFFKIFGYTPKDLQNPDHKKFFSLKDVMQLFPHAKIFGFFPYALLKFTLSHPLLTHYLSPTFIVVAKKESL
ncbi:MAG: class I SAM-dependent methyltransferase [Candidatus Sungiibacteriota bacterium]|uniref:Class I SAM-dependent methyltransferase n=1 Tax=Candidatus Sungiibacteriota bacterium TaxID=2750080 RepID=A0A7T5UQI9_9BACT|nr:MAG: class I SAM-dependent methyltransferase [Candidatus Sungbacteria bacterium]